MGAKGSTKNYLIFGWIGIAAAYIFLIMPHLNKPIVGWEALVWDIPRQITTRGYSTVRFFYLPPLYDSLIALSFKVIGISEFSARLPGIFCFLAMPAVIYFLAKEISEKEDTVPIALTACAIFFTAPLVIQGSLIIDRSDTTVLLLALSLFYLALLKTEGRPLMFRAALLGTLYAMCLWTKVTTPLACLAALPLVYCVCGRFKEGIKVSAAVFSVGIALFVATWGAFCYFVAGMGRFFEPFGYYVVAASGTVRAAAAGVFTRIGLDIFRIYLWLSPFLLILVFASALHVFKRFSQKPSVRIKEMHLLAFAGVVGAGYLYANATFSGFPKYIVPAMPMLACLVANFIWENAGRALDKKESRFLALCVSAGIAFYAIFVKDWVYAGYVLRKAQLNGLLSGAIRHVITQQALYLFFPIAIFLLSFVFIRIPLMKRLCLVLLAALLASNLALDAMQRKAKYSVNFAYGAEGAEALKAFLILKQPADVFSSIEGYVANVGDVSFHAVNADIWDEPGKFSAFMAQHKPECLIYGLAANTAAQLKGTMNDPAIKAYLTGNYDVTTLGLYNVLIRRPR